MECHSHLTNRGNYNSAMMAAERTQGLISEMEGLARSRIPFYLESHTANTASQRSPPLQVLGLILSLRPHLFYPGHLEEAAKCLQSGWPPVHLDSYQRISLTHKWDTTHPTPIYNSLTASECLQIESNSLAGHMRAF